MHLHPQLHWSSNVLPMLCMFRLHDHSTVSVVSSMGPDEKGECASVQWRPSNLATMKEDPRRQLTVLGIVGLCYFSVCGGPIGSEPIISGETARFHEECLILIA